MDGLNFIISFSLLTSIASLIMAVIAIIKVMAMERSTHTITWKPAEQVMSDKEMSDKLEKPIATDPKNVKPLWNIEKELLG